jgi:hypothetical protein
MFPHRHLLHDHVTAEPRARDWPIKLWERKWMINWDKHENGGGGGLWDTRTHWEKEVKQRSSTADRVNSQVAYYLWWWNGQHSPRCWLIQIIFAHVLEYSCRAYTSLNFLLPHFLDINVQQRCYTSLQNIYTHIVSCGAYQTRIHIIFKTSLQKARHIHTHSQLWGLPDSNSYYFQDITAESPPHTHSQLWGLPDIM